MPPQIGSVTVPNTDGWQEYQTFTCDVKPVSGVQDLYLVFTGTETFLMNVDSFRFSGIKGDVNCDRQIDARDLSLCKRAILTKDDSFLSPLGRDNADHDSDGKIAAADAKGILNFVLNKQS